MVSGLGQRPRIARTTVSRMALAIFILPFVAPITAHSASVKNPPSSVGKPTNTEQNESQTPKVKSKKSGPEKIDTRATTSKTNAQPIGKKTANLTQNDKDFETYLDRLMMAESSGRLNAKNPRSTALGPYQFIRSTFLSVARRYFTDEVKGLSDAKILSLRTDLKFARRAAAAYTRENAAHLAAEDTKTTYGNLRLAFLLGPGGAIAVLKASPKARVASILSRGVIRANPFLSSMTASELIARSNREISIDPSHLLSTDGLPKVRRRPSIRVRCNLSRPSCRRWLSLKRSKLKAAGKKKKKRRKASAKKRK